VVEQVEITKLYTLKMVEDLMEVLVVVAVEIAICKMVLADLLHRLQPLEDNQV
jgi:hypothetical protein